jgi:hypothetical protein
LALGYENAYYPKVFLRRHFSLMILLMIGTRRIAFFEGQFLYSICAASAVFQKTELFSRARAGVLSRNLLHAATPAA